MRHKPNWFILPVSAGSEADGIVRDAHIAIGQAPGPSVVIENQPGAGGVVGTAAMTKSSPDGQTLSVGSNSHVISPSGLKSVPFDPPRRYHPDCHHWRDADGVGAQPESARLGHEGTGGPAQGQPWQVQQKAGVVPQ